MTTYEPHVPRTIRWDTATVHDGTLRVELTAAHSESTVWKDTAQEMLAEWTRAQDGLPWRRLTAGSTSLLAEGFSADVDDVPAVQQRLSEFTHMVNDVIAERARAEIRAGQERERAERAARARDERLTSAFRVPPDPRAAAARTTPASERTVPRRPVVHAQPREA